MNVNIGMYSYLPMITDWINASTKWDSMMYGSGLVVFHKCEYIRKFLKWLGFDFISIFYLNNIVLLLKLLLSSIFKHSNITIQHKGLFSVLLFKNVLNQLVQY